MALKERKRDLFQRVVDEGGSLSGAITADDVRDLLGTRRETAVARRRA